MTTLGALAIKDGNGNAQSLTVEIEVSGSLTPHHVIEVNGSPVSQTNALPTKPPAVTYGLVSANAPYVLAASGVAQVLQAAGTIPLSVTIVNPASATEQGIGSAEPIWVNVVSTAVAGGGTASIALEAGASITFGPTTQAVSWVAATAGHLISAYTEV